MTDNVLDTLVGAETPIVQGDTIGFDGINTIPLDSKWAKTSFMITGGELTDALDKRNRFISTADFKFTDTTLGGSIGINARPQYTRYSDVRSPGLSRSRKKVAINSDTGNFGMGRYYSEVLDDNAQTVYLRFGIPQFTSLSSFLKKFADTDATAWATTGKGPGIGRKIGEIIGTVSIVYAAPALALTMIGSKAVFNYFTFETSRYYSLKPTMPLYWSTVNTLLNTIAVHMGLLPKSLRKDKDQDPRKAYQIDEAKLDNLAEIMPHIFTKSYGIDVKAVANRAQRMSNDLIQRSYDRLDTNDTKGLTNLIDAFSSKKIDVSPGKVLTLVDMVTKYMKIAYFSTDGDDGGKFAIDPKTSGEKDGIGDFIRAEFQDGSQFAAFRVDQTGSINESFSSNVKDSDIADKFNSAASSARNVKFNFSGGNIGDGVISNAIESTMGFVTDVLKGTVDNAATNAITFGLAGTLVNMLNGVQMEAPKYWESSDASLPSAEYTMQLISPYNNPISQLHNIYMPLCMLLAAALPLKTGSQSHTSPFVCQLFDQGKMQKQLGMITSLTITRGTTNLPFSPEGGSLGIDVSFTVTDLSPIMSVPLSTGGLFGGEAIHEDSAIFDYLNVLANTSMIDQLYTIPKAKLKLARSARRLDLLTSKASMASMVHETTTSGFLSYALLKVPSVLKAFSDYNNTITK